MAKTTKTTTTKAPLNTAVLAAAMAVASANGAAREKVANAAKALAPFKTRYDAERAEGGDAMAIRREVFYTLAVGAFLGYRGFAGDRTFHPAASAGSIAIVRAKAELMAEGSKGEGSLAAKKAANAKFNEAQLATWTKDVSKDVSRVMDAAGIEHPNPRASKGKAKAPASGKGAKAPASGKGAKAPKAPFNAKTVAPAKFAKGDEGALPLAQNVAELLTMVAQTVNGNTGAQTGELGDAVRAAMEAANTARKALVAAIEKAKAKAETKKTK